MAHILDVSYISGQDNDDSGTGKLRIAADNNQILGQSFTPVFTGPLNRVELYIKRLGTISGNIWVEIHADGADPTAAAQLGSDSALVNAGAVSTSYGYVAFDFATSIILTPGTEYWILLYGDYTYSGSNAIIWGVDTSSPAYAGGHFGRYGNGGAAWEDIGTYDALFKQYSDEVAEGGFLQNFV